MDALERIRSFIEGFSGYAEPAHRKASDEQIRAFVGEAIASLPAVDVEQLAESERTWYERVLLRCEFVNQDAFHVFDSDPTPQRIEATLQADLEVIQTAAALNDGQRRPLENVFARLSGAFDKRDAAMQGA